MTSDNKEHLEALSPEGKLFPLKTGKPSVTGYCRNFQKATEKTKMPLSISHVFHPVLPNFISTQISYSLLPCTSFSAGYSQVQDTHPTLLFHGIKESLH